MTKKTVKRVRKDSGFFGVETPFDTYMVIISILIIIGFVIYAAYRTKRGY